MRLSVLKAEVVLVESLCSESLKVGKVSDVTGLDRLTAAVYAAAGTAHNLDELILALACSDFVKQLSGVLKSGSNRNLNLLAGNFVGSSLDVVCTANLGVVNLLEILTCENVGNGSEGSFHNAACRAEDCTCA